MRSRSIILRFSPIFICLFVLVACERDYKTTADAKPVKGSPEYGVSPEVSETPQAAHVASVAPSLERAPINGAALFTQSCAACHQATGQGIPAVFPPLVNSPYVVGENVDRFAAIMLYGLSGPIKVLGVDYNSAMAGLGAQFDDEELAAIATYVRSSWGNTASEIGADVFTKSREKWGKRGAFTIEELGGNS